MYAELNTKAFDGRLPADLPIEWSVRLNTTAGRAQLSECVGVGARAPRRPSCEVLTPASSREPRAAGGACRQKRSKILLKGATSTRLARIELSTKVLDRAERLRATLAHEMCHVAAWLVDGVSRPPHGDAFRRWAARVERVARIEVNTCHSYDIAFKYRYACTTPGCGLIYKRHSKSIDVRRPRRMRPRTSSTSLSPTGRRLMPGHLCSPLAVRPYQIAASRCGKCRGTLQFQAGARADGTPRQPRKENGTRGPRLAPGCRVCAARVAFQLTTT